MTLPSTVHIKLAECGEPLVDLSEFNFVLDPVYYARGITSDSKMYLRRGVAEKLAELQLSELPGFRFKIWDAWRPLTVQRRLWDDYQAELRREHAGWDEEQLFRAAAVFVAPPNVSGVVPPHLTGGAVDLTLVDAGGAELDMGTGHDHFGPEAHPLYFEHSVNAPEGKQISAVRDNRRLLREVMLIGGFRPNPDEWWDFNFGNAVWADAYGKAAAFYGPAQLPDAADSFAAHGD